MDYELAKSLLDRLFPYKKTFREYEIVSKEDSEPIPIPTLEELIEACGENLLDLRESSGRFTATGFKISEPGKEGFAFTEATKQEAVAKLWLRLQES